MRIRLQKSLQQVLLLLQLLLLLQDCLLLQRGLQELVQA
jgi:hypothetical protein